MSKQPYPKMHASIVNVLRIQQLALSEKEKSSLIEIPQESFDFYNKIIECKAEDQITNIKCIINAVGDSKCKKQHKRFVKCSKYAQMNKLPPKICFKEDSNFGYCLEELVQPVVLSLSQLPKIL